MWSVLQRWFGDPWLDVALSIAAVAIPIVVLATVTSILSRFDITPAGSWYPLVVGTVCGYLVYIAFNELRKARRFSTQPASNPRAAYAEVCGLTDAAGADANVDTALLVLDEARSGYNRAFSGSESVETKASALLSIVAGASSAVGIFGFGKDGRRLQFRTSSAQRSCS